MNLSTREKLALKFFEVIVNDGIRIKNEDTIERAFELADYFKEVSLKTLKNENEKIDFKNTNIS